jgi:hypothetical protein
VLLPYFFHQSDCVAEDVGVDADTDHVLVFPGN